MTDKCAFCDHESKFICDGEVWQNGKGIVPCNKELCQCHTTQTRFRVNNLFRTKSWISHDLCPDCSNSEGRFVG